MPVSRNYKIEGVEVIRETDKALQLRHPEFGEAWFPKSHAMVTKGNLWCSEWIAADKGWDQGHQDDDMDFRDLGRRF